MFCTDLFLCTNFYPIIEVNSVLHLYSQEVECSTDVHVAMGMCICVASMVINNGQLAVAVKTSVLTTLGITVRDRGVLSGHLSTHHSLPKRNADLGSWLPLDQQTGLLGDPSHKIIPQHAQNIDIAQ